jgi:hypothetical protein
MVGYEIVAPVGVGAVWKRIRDLPAVSIQIRAKRLRMTYSEVTQISTSLIKVSSPSVVVLNLANTASSCNCDTGAESVTPE